MYKPEKYWYLYPELAPNGVTIKPLEQLKNKDRKDGKGKEGKDKKKRKRIPAIIEARVTINL